MDQNTQACLDELRARIAVGGLTREDVLELVKELNVVVSELTVTLDELTSQVEAIRRSEKQIQDFRN
jgi:uncharacterized membrane protein